MGWGKEDLWVSLHLQPLKTKSCQDDNIKVTGGTVVMDMTTYVATSDDKVGMVFSDY